MENGIRPLALITGASSGIGLELARQFAKHEYDLVIAAENDKIHAAATELQGSGVSVTAVQVDLSAADGVDRLWNETTRIGRPLAVAALNAGIGGGGFFATGTDLQRELRIVDLNVRSTVHLAKLVLRHMVERNEGAALFTSSIASGMPGSFQAVYNASKSFVQSFALALRNELKDTGITVTSLMPGPTDTEFFEKAHMQDTMVGQQPKDDPADVARQGYEALMAGKERVVASSATSKLMGRGARLLPDSVKAEMHRKMAEPHSDTE